MIKKCIFTLRQENIIKYVKNLSEKNENLKNIT